MSMTGIKNFPKQVSLGRAGRRIILRPLEKSDAHELLEFFRRVPEEDRYFLKEDVTSPQVIEHWVRQIDYSRVLPLVAVTDGEIVADATLHRSRSRAHQHLGELRVVVDPRYRNHGLGTLLLEEMIYIAYDQGVDRLIMDLVVGKEVSAIRVAEMLGFTEVATLPGFARDMSGNDLDRVILELFMEHWRVRLTF
jgi:L-amino acid N-acyltransferase YncA